MRQGIEFSSLTSRRLVNLIYERLTEGLDEEAIRTFEYRLETIGGNIIEPPPPDTVQPPDWWISEEQNWANIQSFLGQASVIDNAVSQAEEVKSSA